MTHLQKLRTTSILASIFHGNHNRSSTTLFQPIGSFHIAQNPRLYSTQRTENIASSRNGCKISRATRRAAQTALLEYLHSTRSLQFMDAEHISKNSVSFLEKILKKMESGTDFARFLRYHPINEFEPFFESLGLKPCEYYPLLPPNLMFLSDDVLLLQNYHVFCNFGIARNKIGKIYKEAMEVFRYDSGVLLSKLQAYKEVGLTQSIICKVIVSSPCLLIGDVNLDFVRVLELLMSMGIEFSWTEEHLLEENSSSYNWSTSLSFLSLFTKTYCSEESGRLIKQHPGLLIEDSGGRVLAMIGFLLKFGSKMSEICLIFQQLPQIPLGKFILNLRQCVLFLNEIEMEVEEIGNIVRSYPILLGSCALKKTNSLLSILSVGKKRLCQYIQENPEEMKKWIMGSKVVPLPSSGEKERSQLLKTKFLLDVGFVENSKQMQKAHKVLRARGGELQERFDCILKAGLDKKDVCEMIKICPLILKQKKDVIKRKIDFFVNDLGYPISSLMLFPQYFCYTTQRVKHRLSMYNWLKDQGMAESVLALSTLITCSDEVFVTRYVNHHPRGPQVWQDLKKQIYSE